MMYTIGFSKFSAACLAIFLLAGCGGGDGVVASSGTQSGKKTAKKKTTQESQDASHIADVLEKQAKNRVDVFELLQQNQTTTVKGDLVPLTGCGESRPQLEKGQLWFYPAKQPQGIVLISHGFLLQPETALTNVIDWAQNDNFSVLLIRLTGHRQDTKVQNMDVTAWKNDEEVGLCMLHQMRQTGGYPHVSIWTHSMSAPLFKVVSHANTTLGSWNKNYARVVHIAPAYTLFYEHIDQLANVLNAFSPGSSLPLGHLFASDRAVRKDVPVQWLRSVLTIQQEAIRLFDSNEQSETPTFSMFHKDDIVIHHNKTFP
ncbi:MAG: hypothetical protein AAF320_05865, partial [Myxococcota bacterium]